MIGRPLGGGAAGASFQGYAGTAIVSADGRTLTVGPYALSCPARGSVVARESTNRVALFVRTLTPAAPPACPPAAGTAQLQPEQTVRLHAPLGGRALVNGATGRATPWISGRRALLPTALPAGYHRTELRPWLNLTRAQIATPTIVQFYQAGPSSNPLEIVQTAGTPPPLGPPPASWTPIEVRGHPGRAAPDVISWREAGLTDYLFLAVQRPAGLHALTTRQLIAIATSAAPGH